MEGRCAVTVPSLNRVRNARMGKPFKVKTRPGDRLLVFDKRGTITHVQTLGKGVVKVSKAERAR